MAKDELVITLEVRRFLPQAYNLKAIADYEMGPESEVPLDRAEMAIENAERFVKCIIGLMERSSP